MRMYDVIIGLEVHVQLATRSKIFCGCSTAFNPDQPNVQTCPVCLGLPGALPVLNRTAFRLAVKTGLALGCQIARYTKWDRKQYFYPDLPKGYQTSQFDLPYSHDGLVKITLDDETGAERDVRIIRAHLEEDAGKNLHDESGRGRDSQVDLNRAGTPLAEIVTQPDLRSAQDAVQFLQELRLMLLYLGVSDCNMQEGSLRCDANVNLHVHGPAGEKIPTPIVEIKNLNSFRYAEAAIEYEIERQWADYQKTGVRMGQAPKETRGFNPDRGMTYSLRSKEEAADYRYFPDPDLAPVVVSEEWLAGVRAEMVELPQTKTRRFRSEYGLSSYDANVVIDQGQALAEYFETVAKACGDGKQAVNWVTQDVQRELNERKVEIGEFVVDAATLAHLLSKISTKQITNKAAKDVFVGLLEQAELRPPSAAEIDRLIDEKGLAIVQDTGAVDAAIAGVLARNEKAVADVKSGKLAAVGALIGQVMKQVKGADPQQVRERILAQIG